MSKHKSAEQIRQHKIQAINTLDAYMEDLISSDDTDVQSNADKLSYWIEDYSRFLKKEKTFNPSRLIRYKKGDIVKIHLGYRIGNEEGGLHFGVVLDVDNKKKDGVVTIVPLTSKKTNQHVHPRSVDISDEFFRLVIGKHDSLDHALTSQLDEATRKLKALNLDAEHVSREEINEVIEQDRMIRSKIKELEAIRASILSMKNGSIALVNQIITISKIRIYDPLYSRNVLYGIRLSPATIKRIDDKIMELYIGNKSKK